MKYGIISTDTATSYIGDFADLNAAKKAAGLNPDEVDHGTADEGVAIVVYEFGMFLPVTDARYFSIGRQLFVGNAVLYAYDEHGETVPLEKMLPVVFYKNAEEVERVIGYGAVLRPQIAVNGNVMWKWPEPATIPVRRNQP